MLLHNMLIFYGARLDDARDRTRGRDANRFRLNRVRRRTTRGAGTTAETTRLATRIASQNVSSVFRTAGEYLWHVLRATRSRPSCPGFGGRVPAWLRSVASGRRRLGDLSIAGAAACGAVSGAIIGMLPFLIGSQHAPGDRPLWVLPVVVTASMSVVCAVSAMVSLPVARWFNRQNESAATH
jgi:hypothetical protein